MDSRLAVARRVLEETEQNLGIRSVRSDDGLHNAYAVPSYLAAVFPQGISRGSVVEVSGSLSLCAFLAGIAAQQGAWIACLGMPTWSCDLAILSGISLEKCALVPHVSHFPAQVLSALVEGFDVVIAPSNLVPYSQQRILTRKVRTRSGLFLSLGNWAGSVHQIHSQITYVSGTLLRKHRYIAEIGPISHLEYKISSWQGSTNIKLTGSGWSCA